MKNTARDPEWARELPAAITVCDDSGIILEMNDRAAAMFRKSGGRELIGTSLLDCHPEPARTTLVRLLEQRVSNAYTVSKKGLRKMVYQAPWYDGGRFGGFVEIVFELPDPLPHIDRDG